MLPMAPFGHLPFLPAYAAREVDASGRIEFGHVTLNFIKVRVGDEINLIASIDELRRKLARAGVDAFKIFSPFDREDLFLRSKEIGSIQVGDASILFNFIEEEKLNAVFDLRRVDGLWVVEEDLELFFSSTNLFFSLSGKRIVGRFKAEETGDVRKASVWVE